MLVKIKLIMISIISLVFLSGCWDDVEIEDRSFTVGIAVDLVEEGREYPELAMTQQVIVPVAFSTTVTRPGQAYRNATAEGRSLFEINRRTTKYASTYITVTHLKVVLFSEDVVKQEKVLPNIMDIFLREMEMRRTINVAIVTGDAKQILTIEPEHELVPALYIEGLLSNEESMITIKPVRLGEVHENLLLKSSFILPQIKKYNDKIAEYEGLAIYHAPSQKVIGTLRENKAKGVDFLRAEEHSGSIITNIGDAQISNEILHVKSKIKLKNKDKDNLQFDINLSVNASIAEVLGSVDLMSNKNYDKIKKALEDEIKKITVDSLDTLQNEMNADVIGINKYLNQSHYKLWESVKDNWEEKDGYFSKSDINVNVNVIIDQPGNINKAH